MRELDYSMLIGSYVCRLKAFGSESQKADFLISLVGESAAQQRICIPRNLDSGVRRAVVVLEG